MIDNLFDSDDGIVPEHLQHVIDAMNGRPKRQSLKGFEHLIPLLPRNGYDPRNDIALWPDRK